MTLSEYTQPSLPSVLAARYGGRTMHPLETYLSALYDARLDGGVAETSGYAALANLLNEVGGGRQGRGEPQAGGRRHPAAHRSHQETASYPEHTRTPRTPEDPGAQARSGSFLCLNNSRIASIHALLARNRSFLLLRAGFWWTSGGVSLNLARRLSRPLLRTASDPILR